MGGWHWQKEAFVMSDLERVDPEPGDLYRTEKQCQTDDFPVKHTLFIPKHGMLLSWISMGFEEGTHCPAMPLSWTYRPWLPASVPNSIREHLETSPHAADHSQGSLSAC